VRSVVAALAGDLAAADDVQLDLPETGVCNTRLAFDDAAPGPADGCGGVAPAAAACCVPAAAAGGACGCRHPAPTGCCA
jgi:hypothetical protein